MRKNKGKSTLSNVEELKQLLMTVKTENMRAESPSARVAEAEVVMAQAVALKQLGHHHAEAQAYLSASSIWIEIERERRNSNLPSTDDALAKGVLCGAIACGILVSQRPNPITSPATRRIGVQPIPLPASKHLTKCWGICFQLGCILYHDFGCMEMAADYFEMASQIVTARQLSVPTQAQPNAAAPGGTMPSGSSANAVPSSGASVAGGAAASVSGRTRATSTAGGAHPPSTPSARYTPTASSKSFASAMERQSSMTKSASSTVPARSQNASIAQPAQDGTASVTGESTEGAVSDANPDTNPASASGHRSSGHEGGDADDDGASSCAGANSSVNSFLGTGHFLLYLTSMHRAVLISCVLKDYPRARSLTDDALQNWRTMQSMRRGMSGTGGAASGQPDLSALDELNTDEVMRQHTDPSVGGADDRTDVASEAPTASASVAGTVKTLVAPSGANTGIGTPVPRRVPPAYNSTQLLATMLQEEEVVLHLHLVRFFLPLLLKESSVVAQRALQELQDLAQLYRELESKSPHWRKGKTSMLNNSSSLVKKKGQAPAAAAASPASGMVPQPSFESNSPSRHGGEGVTAKTTLVRNASFAQSLTQLIGTLDIMLDAYEHFATSAAPGMFEDVLECAVDDFQRLMSATSDEEAQQRILERAIERDSTVAGEQRQFVTVQGVGHRCRELNIICVRAKDQILSIPYDLIGDVTAQPNGGEKSKPAAT